MADEDGHYVIDTSSLIKLRRDYPTEVFPSVWEFMSDLAGSRIVESVELVYDELSGINNDVTKWADKHKAIFLPLSEELQTEAIAILAEFDSGFVDLKKRKSDADPFVVAAGGVYDASIVTEEQGTRNLKGQGKVKIPDVCKHFDIECINLVEMLRREGLSL